MFSQFLKTVPLAIAVAVIAPHAHSEHLKLNSEYIVSSDSGIPNLPRVPEGMDFDPIGQNFFATGIFGGKITTIDGRTGVESEFYQETSNRNQGFGGIKVDAIRRTAWTCAVDLQTNLFPVSQVYAFDVNRSGKPGTLIRKFDLPGAFFCNDIALDNAGNAYATNSIGASVMKIKRSALTNTSQQAEVFATSAQFAPIAQGAIAQNGIVITPNDQYMILAISLPAKLFRISMNNPTDIREITFTGDAFSVNPDPLGDPLRFLGPDGLTFVLRKLYVTSHGGVQELTFNLNFTSASIKTSVDVPTGLSTCTAANLTRLYVIKSEIVPVTQPQLGLKPELPHKIVEVNMSSFH